jgi:hypothetical protein
MKASLLANEKWLGSHTKAACSSLFVPYRGLLELGPTTQSNTRSGSDYFGQSGRR